MSDYNSQNPHTGWKDTRIYHPVPLAGTLFCKAFRWLTHNTPISPPIHSSFLKNRDGLISKGEIMAYFLRAKSQLQCKMGPGFIHNFQEMTYLKPTFCEHCAGFVSICQCNFDMQKGRGIYVYSFRVFWPIVEESGNFFKNPHQSWVDFSAKWMNIVQMASKETSYVHLLEDEGQTIFYSVPIMTAEIILVFLRCDLEALQCLSS